MIMAWLTAKVGARFAKPVLWAGILLLVAVAAFTLAKCTGRDDTAQRQAEQTTRSGDALANAAGDAIATFENRVATDEAIDDETLRTVERINNAESPASVRNAVLDGVCKQQTHRNDPACKVR